MSTPRTDAVLPPGDNVRLWDHTDADYMALINLSRTLERELNDAVGILRETLRNMEAENKKLQEECDRRLSADLATALRGEIRALREQLAAMTAARDYEKAAHQRTIDSYTKIVTPEAEAKLRAAICHPTAIPPDFEVRTAKGHNLTCSFMVTGGAVPCTCEQSSRGTEQNAEISSE